MEFHLKISWEKGNNRDRAFWKLKKKKVKSHITIIPYAKYELPYHVWLNFSFLDYYIFNVQAYSNTISD